MSGFGYNVLGFGANASSAAAGGASDDEFNRVSFLSHFEGSNNGVNNAFDDGSASNHTITANGNVTQGSFGPFARPDGEWGVSFSGDYLEIADDSSLELGSGNFTIECFFNVKQFDSLRTLASKYKTVDGYRSWRLVFQTNGTLSLDITSDGGGSNISNVKTATVFEENTWYHLALVRNSNTITFYINGTADSNTLSFSATPHDNSTPVRIGTQFSSSGARYYHDGFVSNFRIVVGTALYTGNFTAPTSPLTAITNTKLLTCQSNRFVDNSSNGHTITPSGNPAVTAFGPFLPSTVYDPAVNGASAFFDGDNDSLTTGDSADFVLGDTFTLEAWVYPTVSESNDYPMIMSQAEGYPTGWYFSLRYTNEVNFYLNAADNAGGAIDLNTDGSDPVQLNAWNHIALSVSSGTGYIYVNGARKSSAATGINNNLDRSGTTFRVGIHNAAGSYDFDGYICDARVVKGTALYSGTTYTVPTAPLTAITNTKLLLNMADGQAIDSAAQNNLTLVGNTDTSTGQAKFGNTSLFYDGSGDGAYYANGAALGTGDWTIETFLWVNDFDASLGVFQYGGADGALGSLILTNQKIRVLSSNVAARLDTSGTINAQTWYHVAYVSYNGTVKVYINGTADSTTFDASSTTWTFTDTNVYVGARYYSSAVQAPFDGYLDEFRVSHFARYTSNFTAPTAAFADKGQ